jgi:hypothetical protein
MRSDAGRRSTFTDSLSPPASSLRALAASWPRLGDCRGVDGQIRRWRVRACGGEICGGRAAKRASSPSGRPGRVLVGVGFLAGVMGGSGLGIASGAGGSGGRLNLVLPTGPACTLGQQRGGCSANGWRGDGWH